jgi:hypothetical protein
VTVDGLVMSAQHNHATVFATSSTVGRHTTHNTVVHLAFRRHAHAPRHLKKGYVVHLVAGARGSLTHLVVPRVHHVKATAAPASVVVGVVDKVRDGQLLVSQFSHDDGRHGQGSRRHELTVDTGNAKVTVDGGTGRVRAGDLVAVLGETEEDTVLASRVFAFSNEVEALRGRVVGINDGDVAVRSENGVATVTLGSGDSQVPLFLNGSLAATSDLHVGDRIAVLGVLTEEEESFTPLAAFAFNGHDDGPCGDNPPPGHHHHH